MIRLSKIDVIENASTQVDELKSILRKMDLYEFFSEDICKDIIDSLEEAKDLRSIYSNFFWALGNGQYTKKQLPDELTNFLINIPGIGNRVLSKLSWQSNISPDLKKLIFDEWIEAAKETGDLDYKNAPNLIGSHNTPLELAIYIFNIIKQDKVLIPCIYKNISDIEKKKIIDLLKNPGEILSSVTDTIVRLNNGLMSGEILKYVYLKSSEDSKISLIGQMDRQNGLADNFKNYLKYFYENVEHPQIKVILLTLMKLSYEQVIHVFKKSDQALKDEIIKKFVHYSEWNSTDYASFIKTIFDYGDLKTKLSIVWNDTWAPGDNNIKNIQRKSPEIVKYMFETGGDDVKKAIAGMFKTLNFGIPQGYGEQQAEREMSRLPNYISKYLTEGGSYSSSNQLKNYKQEKRRMLNRKEGREDEPIVYENEETGEAEFTLHKGDLITKLLKRQEIMYKYQMLKMRQEDSSRYPEEGLGDTGNMRILQFKDQLENMSNSILYDLYMVLKWWLSAHEEGVPAHKQIRKTVELTQSAINSSDIRQKTVSIEEALMTVHNTGEMLDYFKIDKYELDYLSNMDTSRWDEDLKKMSKRYYKIKLSKRAQTNYRKIIIRRARLNKTHKG